MSNRPSMPGDDVFGLSDNLWGDLVLDSIFGFRDRKYGWGVYDDFKDYGNPTANAGSSTYAQQPVSEGHQYRTYENPANKIVPSSTNYTVPTGFPIMPSGLLGGVNPGMSGKNILYDAGAIIPTPGQIILQATAANDNLAIVMAPANASTGHTGLFTPYPLTNMIPMNVYFETRLKFSDLATGFTTFFIGLASGTLGAANNPCATTAFSTTPGLLGFGCVSGDTTETLGLVYNKAGGTVSSQGVSNMAGLNLLTLLGSSGDYTKGYLNIGSGVYFKLGFKYDATMKTVTPYINGVPLDGIAGPNKIIGSGSLSTNLGSAAPGTGSSTLWPAAPMTLCAGLFQTSTTYQTVTLDWWAAAQSAV